MFFARRKDAEAHANFSQQTSVQGWKVAKSAVAGNGCENYFYTVSSVSLHELSNFDHLQFIVELESNNEFGFSICN